MEKGFQFLKKALLSGIKVLTTIIYDGISPSLFLLFWALSEALYIISILNSFYFTFKMQNEIANFLAKTLNLFTFAFYKNLQSAQSQSTIPPFQYFTIALTISIITAVSKKSLGSLSKAILIIFVIIIFLSTPLVFYLLDTAFNAFQKSLTLQALLNLSNASILCLIIYCFEKLGTEVHYHSQTSILATYNQSTPFIKIAKIFLSVALTKSKIISATVHMWLLTLFALIIFFEIKSLLSYRKYMNIMLQKVYQIILVTQVASVLLILLCHSGLASINLNFEATLLVIIVLSVKSMQTFQKWRWSKQILDRISQTTEATAVSQVLEIIRTFLFYEGNANQQNELTKSFIFQNHRVKCEDPSCYCKSKSNEVSFQRTNVIIKQLFEEKIKKLPNSYSLKLIQLGFNAKQHSAVLTTLISLQRFEQRTSKESLSLQDSLIISKIFDSLTSKFIYEQDSLPSNVRCEHIFQQQNLKKNISLLLIDLLNDFISKYKYLSSQAYHLNVVEEHSIRICKKICLINQEWFRFQGMDSSNYDIYQIFIFYHFNVLPTVLEGRAIASQIIKKFQKLSNLKGLGKQTIHSRLYSKNTCIVESNIQQSFGVITNISTSSTEVFGYRSITLIGKHINTIMPLYFSKAHDDAITDWVNNFKLSDNQKEIIEFGYIDAKQVCFQGNLLMKVCAKMNEVFFYTMIIRQNDEDYLLINSKKIIEGIGKRLLSKRLFDCSSINQPISDYFEFNFDEKLAQNPKIKSWINFQSYISLNFSDNEVPQVKNKEIRYIFQCSVTISKLYIYHEHYFIIKFDEIIRCSTSSEKFKSIRIKDSKQFSNHSWEIQSYQRTKAEQIFDMDEYDSIQPIKERIFNTKIMGDHSSASSVSSSTGPASKLIFSVKAYLIQPQKIRIGLFKSASIWLFVCGMLVIGFFYGLQTIFSSGFSSFNDVMFGDGAVSDNNQIFEMLYNNIMMGKIYCKHAQQKARCAYLKQSTAIVSNILYQLYIDDLEVYLKNTSMLTRTKFYESFEIKVPFRVGDTNTEVKTLQFMEYYYYAIRKSYILITEGRDNSEQGEETMSILYDNWEAMKYINHEAIYLYMDIGEQELNLLLAFVLALALGLLGLIIGIFFLILKFNRYINNKKYTIMSLHVSIDHKVVLEMLDYYGFLVDIIKTNKFKIPHFLNSDQTIKLGNRRMPYVTGKARIFQVLTLLIIIFLFAAIEITQIATLLPSCKKMVQMINDLMDTENFLLENYFEMKTYYMAYNYSKSVDQITMEIATHLNQSEPVFTSKAKESLNIFASTDPAFVEDFNVLLVDNICSLTSWVFEKWGVDYCNSNFTYSIMELGLVNSMVFFQRNAYSALMELYSKQKESINKVDYFTSAVFRDIDDSLFYMFRLYQATQARMYQSLNYSISTSLVLLQLINALSMATILVFYLWWLWGYSRTQKDLKYLYGVVLQLPQGLISNKQVKTCITESLQIQL